MSQSTICRLCVQACNDFESLYNDNGRANELHVMTREYFHPKIVDMEANKHLNAVCVKCARHIYDFHHFQAAIAMAQLTLTHKMQHRMVTIKTEKLEENISEDFPNSAAVFSENAFNIIEMEEDESISETYIHSGNYKAFKVSEQISSADEFETQEFNITQGPMNSTKAPMIEITNNASTVMPDPTDFTVKTELETIATTLMPDPIDFTELETIATTLMPDPIDFTELETMATTLMPDPTDFTVKPELEIIDVHQNIEHSSDDDADIRTPLHNGTICGNSFTHKPNLLNPMDRQHGNNGDTHHMEREQPAMSQTANNSGNISSEPGFVCEIFKCHLCDYASELKGSYRRHVKQLHEITAPKLEFDYEESTQMFKCKVCQAAFRFENSLRKHMEQNHWEQNDVSQKFEYDFDDTTKVYRCKVCGSFQENRQLLVTHMAGLHWVTPSNRRQHIVCQICDKSFATNLELAQHYNKTHCPPGLHPCNECGRFFNQYPHLQQHRRKIHSSRPQPHKCEHCCKTFRIPCELKRHLQSHTATKMYPCPFCVIKFKYSTNLVQHVKRLHPRANVKH